MPGSRTFRRSFALLLALIPEVAAELARIRFRRDGCGLNYIWMLEPVSRKPFRRRVEPLRRRVKARLQRAREWIRTFFGHGVMHEQDVEQTDAPSSSSVSLHGSCTQDTSQCRLAGHSSSSEPARGATGTVLHEAKLRREANELCLARQDAAAIPVDPARAETVPRVVASFRASSVDSAVERDLGNAGVDLGGGHGALKTQSSSDAAAVCLLQGGVVEHVLRFLQQVITRELRTVYPCAHLKRMLEQNEPSR